MQSSLSRVLKEPLLHFLLIGCSLFALFDIVAGEQASADNYTITVDRAGLFSFMQYRSRNVNAKQLEAELAAMTPEQRQSLIDEYIQQEVLYREAKALNLDQGDYVARLRLIRQFKYLAGSFIDPAKLLNASELNDYYQNNLARYSEPEKRTFTHVFFSTQSRPAEQASALAKQQLQHLNQQNVPFHQSMAHGERFLYHTNYVNKDAEFVASHFGSAFQQAVFALSADNNTWHGPFQSTYGYHLVMVTQLSPALTPMLDDVRARVEVDLKQEKTQQKMQDIISSIREQYTVNVQNDLVPALATQKVTKES